MILDLILLLGKDKITNIVAVMQYCSWIYNKIFAKRKIIQYSKGWTLNSEYEGCIVMARHLAKKAVHIVTLLVFALASTSCSKSSAGKKKISKPKSEFSDHRRPRDNQFIQEGGYSKKAKVNPFVTDGVGKTSPKASQQEDSVVYEKPVAKVTKDAISPVAYNTGTMTPKKGFLKTLFTKIAAIFPSKTSAMTQVASRSTTYRPMVNKMVMDEGYTPDHSNLTEQGSFDDGYLYSGHEQDVLYIEPTAPIESKSMFVPPVLKTEVKKSKVKVAPLKPVVTKAVLTMPKLVEIPMNIESDTMPLVKGADVVISSNQKIEQQLSNTITGLVNVSKILYGISVDEDESVESLPDVNVPEIGDDDLKNRSGKKQQLSDIPPVPKEFSSQES